MAAVHDTDSLSASLTAAPPAPKSASSPVDRRIADFLRSAAPAQPVGAQLRALVGAGLDRLPLPGGGATLHRWQALAAVARDDLALAKLYEGHTDALAILAEIDGDAAPAPGTVYAVWASESPVDPIVLRTDGTVRVDGRKSWCSGAAVVNRALMTARDAHGGRHLVEVALDAAGLRIDRAAWQAVGMHDSESFDVVCDGVAARRIGAAGAYLDRPGFWHGGGGVAACWLAGAAAIGTRVRDLQVGRGDVHALAHLGAIDGALAGATALARDCAQAIDAAPRADAMHVVMRLRNQVAETCEVVASHALRALGPGPLCNDRHLARLVADLPVFVRQARAEHDLVAQARALLGDDAALAAAGWPL